MSDLRTVDTHTHVLTEETAALLRREAPKVPVTITPLDAASATLDVGDVAYRPFPRGGFDIEHRLRDMDAAGVDMQVLSVTPQTYLYNQELFTWGVRCSDPERSNRQTGQAKPATLYGYRNAADAGARKGRG
jgi:hypothetical protein